MVFYAVFAGAPIIIVGFLGVEIQKRIPRVYSFSDYVQRVSFLWPGHSHLNLQSHLPDMEGHSMTPFQMIVVRYLLASI